ASIRLYLETLERRDIPDEKRREFYRVMMNDTDLLRQRVEQVLRAGKTSARVRVLHQVPIDLRQMVPECLELARVRHHLPTEAPAYHEALGTGDPPRGVRDPDALKE